MGGFIMKDNIMDSKEVQEQVFGNLKIDDAPQQALHFEWEDLSVIFSALLSGLLDREIEAQAEREKYYYWLIRLYHTPLTQAELEKLFHLAGTDELDREQNDLGEYPITELCQSLCGKLMNKLLPYPADAVRADDEGVWFIGFNTVRAVIKKALPDGTALVAETWDEPEYPGIRISIRSPGLNDELLCFVEHSSSKPAGKELCIAAYSSNQDEPAYYESYSDPQPPSQNV
jgi:hypothetical protein